MSTKTILTLVLVTFLIPVKSQGQVFKTQQEALKLAFPEDSKIERRVLFLTDGQIEAVEQAAKTKMDSKLVTYYEATSQDSVLGYAFFEKNIVRTKPETFMGVLNSDGSVRFIEILAFYEPFDYLPTPNWLFQFKHKILDNDLWPKRGIHNITGATLTARAITQGVRKIIAIYNTLIKQESRG